MTIGRRFIRDCTRSTLWWSLGVLALVAFTVAFWPTVRGETSFDEIVGDLPEAMRAMFGIDAAVSIGSAPGYVHGRVFATLLPLLLITRGISLGARAIAGSEEDGTLELLLANPVRRGDVLTARLLSMIALVAVPAAVAGVALAVLGAPFDMLAGITAPRLALATLAALALGELHACIAFAIGSATGRRSVAVGAAAAVAAGGYLLQGLLAAADGPAALRNLIPWHWYLERNILLSGAPTTALVLPVVVGAAVVAVGAAVFLRRDLR